MRVVRRATAWLVCSQRFFRAGDELEHLRRLEFVCCIQCQGIVRRGEFLRRGAFAEVESLQPHPEYRGAHHTVEVKNPFVEIHDRPEDGVRDRTLCERLTLGAGQTKWLTHIPHHAHQRGDSIALALRSRQVLCVEGPADEAVRRIVRTGKGLAAAKTGILREDLKLLVICRLVCHDDVAAVMVDFQFAVDHLENRGVASGVFNRNMKHRGHAVLIHGHPQLKWHVL